MNLTSAVAEFDRQRISQSQLIKRSTLEKIGLITISAHRR